MNHYERLGVERGVSDVELRRAYRRRAAQLHPDRNPQDTEGATERMAMLNDAFETLSDPVRRFDYNRSIDKLAGRREERGVAQKRPPTDATSEAPRRPARREAAPPPPNPTPSDDAERRARREAKERAAAAAAARGYRDPGQGRMNFKAPK